MLVENAQWPIETSKCKLSQRFHFHQEHRRRLCDEPVCSKDSLSFHNYNNIIHPTEQKFIFMAEASKNHLNWTFALSTPCLPGTTSQFHWSRRYCSKGNKTNSTHWLKKTSLWKVVKKLIENVQKYDARYLRKAQESHCLVRATYLEKTGLSKELNCIMWAVQKTTKAFSVDEKRNFNIMPKNSLLWAKPDIVEQRIYIAVTIVSTTCYNCRQAKNLADQLNCLLKWMASSRPRELIQMDHFKFYRNRERKGQVTPLSSLIKSPNWW